jgi:hypothetical protein
MCTVSIVRDASLTRVICNRDEQRVRAAATPPQEQTRSGVRMLFPVDPHSRGTWIGANQHGLVLTLLNASRPSLTPARHSRGSLIPWLLSFKRLVDAVDASRSINTEEFAAFHLIALQGDLVASLSSGRGSVETWAQRLTEPLLWTSSSLGDDIVDGPRRRLFNEMLRAHRGNAFRCQAAFHRHQWKSRPAISVSMARADARTVSRTTVDITGDHVCMVYEALSDDVPITLHQLTTAA